MARNTLEKLRDCLVNGKPEITWQPEFDKAREVLERSLLNDAAEGREQRRTAWGLRETNMIVQEIQATPSGVTVPAKVGDIKWRREQRASYRLLGDLIAHAPGTVRCHSRRTSRRGRPRPSRGCVAPTEFTVECPFMLISWTDTSHYANSNAALSTQADVHSHVSIAATMLLRSDHVRPAGSFAVGR